MNTAINAKRIMVFGDSLSWGYQPNTDHFRFDAQIRWPGRLQILLGGKHEVIEECLNSRGIENGDSRPGKEGRRALDYIEAALDSHDPLDMVIVLLGTNELKHEMNMTAEGIGESMKKLLAVIQSRPSQFRDTKPDVVLLSPPLVNEQTDYTNRGSKYLGATEKSKQLANVYQAIAEQLNIQFLDLSAVPSGPDGVHFTAEEHSKVAELVYELIA